MSPTSARSGLCLGAILLAGLSPAACLGQDARSAFPPPGWRAHRVKVESGRVAHRRHGVVTREAFYRGLTINGAPIAPYGSIYDDGETRYNDIASFDPAPAITSGTEFPYGLDGIGGYGIDLGFTEGQDASVYQRQR